MNWSMPDWEPPMFVKVVSIATVVCAIVVGVITLIAMGMSWIANTWSEDVAAAVFFGGLMFLVVCLFTWMILDD